MSDGLDEGDILQYQVGTAACGSTRVLALQDQAGNLWVSIEDFLHRNAEWICTHPRYFDIPNCPSAVVISEGKEVLFAGAAELSAIIGRPIDGFELARDPAAGPVASN